MSQGHRTLKDRMAHRLAHSGSWVGPETLADGLSTSRRAIEDALADLVTEQLAEFKPGAGYRLHGSELCRTALRTLKRSKVRLAVEAKPFEGVNRIGVAEHRDGLGVVIYELELPLPPEGDGYLDALHKQTNSILKFINQKADAHESR